MGSEDMNGISSTVVDDSDDIIDFDTSPGEDDKIEEELNKTSTVTPTSSPFGSPSSIFNTSSTPTTTGSSTPFGSPSWNSGMFGVNSNPNYSTPQTPSSSIWGSGNNNNNYSIWGNNNNNNNNSGWYWGNNNNYNNNYNPYNNSSNWNSGWGNNNTQKPGNGTIIRKNIIFCSFIDTIVSSFSSFANGRLAIINQVPANLTDMYIRKEVLFKMSRITADIVYILIPSEIIRGFINATSLSEKDPEEVERGIAIVSDYIRLCVMTYMKHTIPNLRMCQTVLVTNNDFRVVSNYVENEIRILCNSTYKRDQIVFLGANGGANGYGAVDKMIAESCKIDFLDTNVLLSI